MRKTLKRLSKAVAVTCALILCSLFIAWFTLNEVMGCGMVNDWNHPSCMTPSEMLLGK